MVGAGVGVSVGGTSGGGTDLSVGSNVGVASGVSVAWAVGLDSGPGLSCCVHAAATATRHNTRSTITNKVSLERIMASASEILYLRIRGAQGIRVCTLAAQSPNSTRNALNQFLSYGEGNSGSTILLAAQVGDPGGQHARGLPYTPPMGWLV